MTYQLSPSSTLDLAGAVQGAIPDAAVMRIGVVTYYNATKVTVAISGSDVLVGAAYLFGQYQPVLGDNVALLKQGNQWLVLGATSSPPQDNLIENWSFEMDPDGTNPPTGWGWFNDPAQPGSPNVAVDLAPTPIDGPLCCRVFGSSTGLRFGNVVYSDAISVRPGQVMSASASVTWYTEGVPEPGTIRMWLLWYAVITTPVFSDASASTATELDSIDTHPGNHPGWWLLRRQLTGVGAIVPDGINWMRVAFVAQMPEGGYDVQYDRVIARRLG